MLNTPIFHRLLYLFDFYWDFLHGIAATRAGTQRKLLLARTSPRSGEKTLALSRKLGTKQIPAVHGKLSQRLNFKTNGQNCD